MANDRKDKTRNPKRTTPDKRGRAKDESGSPKANASEDRMSQRSRQRDLDSEEGPFIADSDMDNPTPTRHR